MNTRNVWRHLAWLLGLLLLGFLLNGKVSAADQSTLVNLRVRNNYVGTAVLYMSWGFQPRSSVRVTLAPGEVRTFLVEPGGPTESGLCEWFIQVHLYGGPDNGYADADNFKVKLYFGYDADLTVQSPSANEWYSIFKTEKANWHHTETPASSGSAGMLFVCLVAGMWFGNLIVSPFKT